MPHAGRGQHRVPRAPNYCVRLAGAWGSSDTGRGEREPSTQEETQHGSLCTHRGRILHRGGGITSGLAKVVVKVFVPPLPLCWAL